MQTQVAPRRAHREPVLRSSPQKPKSPTPTQLAKAYMEATEIVLAAEQALVQKMVELGCVVVTAYDPVQDKDVRLALVGGQLALLNEPGDEALELIYRDGEPELTDEEILESARYHAAETALGGEPMIATPDHTWPTHEVGAGVTNTEVATEAPSAS